MKFLDPSGYIPIPPEEEGESYQSLYDNPLDDPWLNPQYYYLDEMWKIIFGASFTDVYLNRNIRAFKGGGQNGIPQSGELITVTDKSGKKLTFLVTKDKVLLVATGGGGNKLKAVLDNLKYAIPVAITWAAVGSAEGVMAGQVTPAGYGLILRGPNRYQSIGFSSAGAGAGWVGADGSIATTYYFYTGDVNNFNRFSLNGQAWDLSISCGEGWSVGINLSVAQDRYGAYIIGIGPSAGVGASATFFTGQYSMTLTKIWR